MPCIQGGELLAQSEIFQKQVAVRTKGAADQTEEESQRSGHAAVVAELTVCKYV
jgi:hypothetical protein